MPVIKIKHKYQVGEWLYAWTDANTPTHRIQRGQIIAVDILQGTQGLYPLYKVSFGNEQKYKSFHESELYRSYKTIINERVTYMTEAIVDHMPADLKP